MVRDDEAATYRDGTGNERCATCLHALRNATGEPLTSVRYGDVEAAVRVLARWPEHAALVERLRYPLGLNLAQIEARAALEGPHQEEVGYGFGI